MMFRYNIHKNQHYFRQLLCFFFFFSLIIVAIIYPGNASGWVVMGLTYLALGFYPPVTKDRGYFIIFLLSLIIHHIFAYNLSDPHYTTGPLSAVFQPDTKKFFKILQNKYQGNINAVGVASFYHAIKFLSWVQNSTLFANAVIVLIYTSFLCILLKLMETLEIVKHQKIILLLLILLPNQIVFSSMLLRETPQLITLILTIFYIIRVIKNNKIMKSDVFFLITSCLIFTSLHQWFYFYTLFLFFLAIAYSITILNWKSGKHVIVFLLAILSILLTYTMGDKIINAFTEPKNILQKNNLQKIITKKKNMEEKNTKKKIIDKRLFPNIRANKNKNNPSNKPFKKLHKIISKYLDYQLHLVEFHAQSSYNSLSLKKTTYFSTSLPNHFIKSNQNWYTTTHRILFTYFCAQFGLSLYILIKLMLINNFKIIMTFFYYFIIDSCFIATLINMIFKFSENIKNFRLFLFLSYLAYSAMISMTTQNYGTSVRHLFITDWIIITIGIPSIFRCIKYTLTHLRAASHWIIDKS